MGVKRSPRACKQKFYYALGHHKPPSTYVQMYLLLLNSNFGIRSIISLFCQSPLNVNDHTFMGVNIAIHGDLHYKLGQTLKEHNKFYLEEIL